MINIDLRKMKRVVIALSGVVILLGLMRDAYVLVFGTDTILKSLRPFNLHIENTTATWYSSMLLLLNAVVLYVIARLTRQNKKAMAGRWMFLAFVFVLLSVDETASFHESLAWPIREAFGLSGVFAFAWVIPGAVFVLLLAIFYAPMLRALPRRTAVGFLLAGSIFVFGALGLELVQAYYFSLNQSHSAISRSASLIEESLEIIGMTIFFVVLTDYLTATFREWSFGAQQNERPSSP